MTDCPECGALLDGVTCAVCGLGKVRREPPSDTPAALLARRPRAKYATPSALMSLVPWVGIEILPLVVKRGSALAVATVAACFAVAILALVWAALALVELRNDRGRAGRIAAWTGLLFASAFILILLAAVGRVFG